MRDGGLNYRRNANIANNLFASSCDNQRPIVACGTCPSVVGMAGLVAFKR